MIFLSSERFFPHLFSSLFHVGGFFSEVLSSFIFCSYLSEASHKVFTLCQVWSIVACEGKSVPLQGRDPAVIAFTKASNFTSLLVNYADVVSWYDVVWCRKPHPRVLPKTSDLNLVVPLDLTSSVQDSQETQGQVKRHHRETIRQILCEILFRLNGLIPSKSQLRRKTKGGLF